MNDTSNLRDTIIPKSDQLNADDLLGTTRTVTVTSVSRGSTPEQPVTINYEGDNGRPYKPCKSMRRVMIHAWGDDGREWVGRSMTLYTDPEVKFGGVKVGGIRISHLSDIPRVMDIALTATKGKRTPYQVQPLEVAMYPADRFEKALTKIHETIRSGKMNVDQAIAHCEKTGKLTPDMKQRVAAYALPDEPAAPEPTTNENEVF